MKRKHKTAAAARAAHRLAVQAYGRRKRDRARDIRLQKRRRELARGNCPEFDVDEAIFLTDAEFRATCKLSFEDFVPTRPKHKVPVSGGY